MQTWYMLEMAIYKKDLERYELEMVAIKKNQVDNPANSPSP